MSERYERIKLFNRRLMTWLQPEFVVVDQLGAVRNGTVGGYHDNNASSNMVWEVNYNPNNSNTVAFRNVVTGQWIAPGKGNTLMATDNEFRWSFVEEPGAPGLFRINRPGTNYCWSLLDSHDRTPISLVPSDHGDNRQVWLVEPY